MAVDGLSNAVFRLVDNDRILTKIEIGRSWDHGNISYTLVVLLHSNGKIFSVQCISMFAFFVLVRHLRASSSME